MQFVKGPDFPTGAIVEGKEGILNALKTGKGKVIVRSKTQIIEEKNMNKIVVSQIPYEVNKAELVRKLDEIRFSKNIDGIIEVRDESDRNGLSIVIDLKKDVNVQNTLNYFYKNTDLQKNYNYNMVAIKDRKPVLMGLSEIIDGYINHAIEVVTKRSIFDLEKANARKHIVDGLIKAVSILDDVVKTIRKSKDKSDAKINLEAQYGFSEKQAEAIVTLQLYRLTNTDIVALQNELNELNEFITSLNQILNDDKVLKKVIINELKQIKKDYPTPRLTEIKDEIQEVNINEEDMILPEDIYVSITYDGYIKRISQRSVSASNFDQFGKKEDDHLIDLHLANTLNKLLVFTDKGRYLYVPIHKLEEFKWKDLGKHISYLVKISNDEKIIKTILVDDFKKPFYVVLTSKNGQIKRVALSDFEVVRYSKPIKCMNLKDDDELVDVSITNGHYALILSSQKGYASLYDENEISIVGIKAGGIKGMKLVDDEIVSLSAFDPLKVENYVLITKQGGIKRMHISDIPTCKRATKGILTFKTLKTKSTDVLKAFVCSINTEIKVYDENQEYKQYLIKDINYSSYDSRVSALKDFKGEVNYMYYDYILNTSSMEINEKIDVVKEEHKEEYETISFEDLFGDEF
jgi:topoisomerase-4 subunit A